MKFKVGDIVKIKTREDIKEKLRNTILNIEECSFIPEMEEYAGQVAQIKDITRYGAYKLDTDCGAYKLDIDCGEYNWSDYMFEPYTVEIRKSDLEDEDYCMFKNKNKAIKIGKYVVMDGGAIPLKEYNNKLEHNFDSNYDIVRVDRPTEYKTIYKNDEILDSTEKKYLKSVIRPFRDKIEAVTKEASGSSGSLYYLNISLKNDDFMCLPSFNPKAMYVGMKVDKEYTLEELGL